MIFLTSAILTAYLAWLFVCACVRVRDCILTYLVLGVVRCTAGNVNASAGHEHWRDWVHTAGARYARGLRRSKLPAVSNNDMAAHNNLRMGCIAGGEFSWGSIFLRYCLFRNIADRPYSISRNWTLTLCISRICAFKVPLLHVGGICSPSNTCFLGPLSLHPKWHFDWFSHLCRAH